MTVPTRPSDYPYRPYGMVYTDLRADVEVLEGLIDGSDLDEKTLKRLDKAVTTIKVGLKVMKRALKRSGSHVEAEEENHGTE